MNDVWRYIPFQRLDPFIKTALNDVLIENVRITQQPLLWLSGWSCDCINLGVSQDYERVIDVEQVIKDNIVVTRRQSGGGTTFLTKDGEITWAIIVPSNYFHGGVNEIYAEVCNMIIDELSNYSIDAYFKPINDIRTKNGKLSGSTLRKEQGVVYVGGTLLYTSQKEKMNCYLKPENDLLKKESIIEKEKKITSISEESSLSFDETINLLKNAFLNYEEFEEKSLLKEELLKAQNISRKYSTQEWIKYGRTK